MLTYHDPTNVYPYADLLWEGPGYYAGIGLLDTFSIYRIAGPDHEGPWPHFATRGFGTISYAATPAEAAGAYAGYEVPE